MRKNFQLHDGKKGAALAVHVIPRAQHDEIVEMSGDGSVRVRLNSPADDESLNENLLVFLSGVLSVGREKLEIVAGHTGRNKLVSVLDMSSQVAQERILSRL
ncbi:MAG TPA: DUF167 domain-containing protein [Anaerolineales bacterium]|nr:DUF167 domain-containing protein [Anaerolineales bacterium]